MMLPHIPYCEDFAATLPLAQPLNALSNLTFLLAAALLWRACRPATLRARLLILSVGLIGVTSLIWHVDLRPALLALDFAGILVFQTLVWFWGLAPQLGWGARQAAGGFAGLILLMLAAHLVWPDAWTPGSGVFVPVLMLLLVLAKRLPTLRRGLLQAAAALAAAFAARLADVPTCGLTTGLGTHWLWHGLTALAAYILTRTLLRPTA